MKTIKNPFLFVFAFWCFLFCFLINQRFLRFTHRQNDIFVCEHLEILSSSYELQTYIINDTLVSLSLGDSNQSVNGKQEWLDEYKISFSWKIFFTVWKILVNSNPFQSLLLKNTKLIWLTNKLITWTSMLNKDFVTELSHICGLYNSEINSDKMHLFSTPGHGLENCYNKTCIAVNFSSRKKKKKPYSKYQKVSNKDQNECLRQPAHVSQHQGHKKVWINLNG